MTKLAGIHDTIKPPPKSIATELLGLLSHATLHDNKTPMNAKVKHSYMRALPLPLSLCPPGMGTSYSPLDHNPKYLNFWSKDPRDRVFGAIPNAFSSKFSGFSLCHPVYDDQLMHSALLRHAMYSAIANNSETAEYMFLPCWGGRMSTNPYSKLINALPHICCTLGTIFSSNLDYANPSFCICKGTLLPCHNWSMQIIAAWNTAARLRLNNHNPTWVRDLACDIPE